MITFLLVEDDDGQAELVHRLFNRTGICNPLVRVTGGREAVDYVNYFTSSRSTDPDSKSGVVVLLDINMPGMDGFEVLEWIRSIHSMSELPVIVISTTDDPDELTRAYALGCNAHLGKPFDVEEFFRTASLVGVHVSIRPAEDQPRCAKGIPSNG